MITIRFPEDNNIRFLQDMQIWEGLPSGITFYLALMTSRSIKLVADGYGILPEHGLSGRYGNGAVFIHKRGPADRLIFSPRQHY